MQRGNSGPVTIETRIGWVLLGPIEDEVSDQSVVGFTNTHTFRVDTTSEHGDVDKELRRFWELESIGIRSHEELVHSKFTQEIILKNGRYEVSLPWRKSQQSLSENYDLCVKRLTTTRPPAPASI